MAGYASSGSLGLTSNTGLNSAPMSSLLNGPAFTGNSAADMARNQAMPSYSVLGAAVGPGSISGGGGGGTGVTKNTAATTPQTNNTGAPDVSGMINNLYQPHMDYLNNLQSQIGQNRDTDLAALQTNMTNQQNKQAQDFASFNNQWDQSNNQFGQQFQSAYANALRQYQNASQQGKGLYGGYGGASSAGEGVQNYLNQLGASNQMGLQQNLNSGELTLAGQKQDINQWDATQTSNLGQWHQQAYDDIQHTYQSGLSAIANDMTMTQEAKTNAQLGLLEQAINERTQLDNYGAQLSNQLSMINAMQGLNYSPMNQTGFQNQIAGISNSLGQAGTGANMTLGLSGQSPQQAQSMWTGGMNNSDLLKQLGLS